MKKHQQKKTVLISFYRVREQRRLFYALCRSTRIIITFPNDVENIIFSISPSSKTLNFLKANRYNSLFSLNFRWLLRPWRSGRCGRHHPTGGQNRFLISENFPVHRVHRLIFSSLLTLWPQLSSFRRIKWLSSALCFGDLLGSSFDEICFDFYYFV